MNCVHIISHIFHNKLINFFFKVRNFVYGSPISINLLLMALNLIFCPSIHLKGKVESGLPQTRSTEGTQPEVSPSPGDGLLPVRVVQNVDVSSSPIQPVKTLVQKNKRFTYNEILSITSNLERPIGKGGFGTVYHGRTMEGTQVAVKILSLASAQGPKEFEREVSDALMPSRTQICSSL